jgi:MFS family permease
MAFIDSTVVNVALPSLQASLHATVVGVQWVVESYELFLGAMILVGGSFGDSFGRRLMFLFGVGIFAAASIACGFASNIIKPLTEHLPRKIMLETLEDTRDAVSEKNKPRTKIRKSCEAGRVND